MGKKIDFESVAASVASILQANLAAKCAEINADKNDGLNISDIPAAAYFFQTFNDKILNSPVAILYGFQGIRATPVGPETANALTIFIDLFILDNGQDDKTVARVLRYSRALREIFEKNWDKLAGGSKILIETSIPVAFKDDTNSSTEYKVGGIMISTSIF